jgi:hypothetical protein
MSMLASIKSFSRYDRASEAKIMGLSRGKRTFGMSDDQKNASRSLKCLSIKCFQGSPSFCFPNRMAVPLKLGKAW